MNRTCPHCGYVEQRFHWCEFGIVHRVRDPHDGKTYPDPYPGERPTRPEAVQQTQ